MFKINLIIIFLLPFSTLSFGNWIKYFNDHNGNTHYYKNLEKKGKNIIFYNMADSIRPNKKGVYCTIDKRIADCKDFSLKYLEYKFFRGPLCVGKPETVPLETIESFGWKKNLPNSTDYMIIKKLCKKISSKTYDLKNTKIF